MFGQRLMPRNNDLYHTIGQVQCLIHARKNVEQNIFGCATMYHPLRRFLKSIVGLISKNAKKLDFAELANLMSGHY